MAQVQFVLAVVAVSDIDAGRAWYTTLFGREPDNNPNGHPRCWVLTRIDGLPRHVSRDSRIHGFAQCRYLVEQSGEIIAPNMHNLGFSGRRHGRITQLSAVKRRFADDLSRSHHRNAVLADINPRLPAEQDVAGV